MSAEELAFMERFKIGERAVPPGTEILTEGEASGELYTVLSGMGLRFKLLEDGRRQVLGVTMPGDFLGLQAGVMDRMHHSVETRTEVTLCIFRRDALWHLFRDFPERGYDLTWLAALEEHFLGERLVTVAQLSGLERVARGLLRLFERGVDLGLVRNGRLPLPFIQQDLADGLGLSLVHTNKLLRQLRSQGIARWADGGLTIYDLAGLRAVAGMANATALAVRPLI